MRSLSLPAGLIGLVLVPAIAACAMGPAPVVIHDSPRAAVRVQFDPEAGHGHGHPALITPEQMATILRGVWVTKRDVLGLGALLQDPEAKPAFSAAEIVTLAPHLSEALRKASPKDVATFYLALGDPSLGKLVTSGGLFVRQGQLYLILANWRTPLSAGPFEGMAYELDSRNDPLFSIARYRFAVGFTPREAWILHSQSKDSKVYDRYVDPAKLLVIDLSRLLASDLPH
ncbi:MAG: hypothetical protein ACREIO_07920 [Nitrospiraceae bacterium]